MYIIVVINIVNGIRTNTMMFLKNFDISFNQAITALKKAIESECPELVSKSKDYILNHAFNDITFQDGCKCCGKKFDIKCRCCCCKNRKKNKNNIETSSLLDSLI